jgi:hypothetical protein
MIIENFNKHFSTAGRAFHLATPTPVNSSAPPHSNLPKPPHFSFGHIQTSVVLKELQNLDPYKSAGLHNMDPLFLKLSATIVATPITSLFNLYFVSSEIPIDWKAAAVIPLFKEGNTLDPNCYRPTSILPCLSKAKLTNRSPANSNPTVPSPLCNLVSKSNQTKFYSELVTGAPQKRSRS